MGRKSGSSVLKRQRELKKAEKAAQKKERGRGEEKSGEGPQVADAEDLAAYGFPVGDDEEERRD